MLSICYTHLEIQILNTLKDGFLSSVVVLASEASIYLGVVVISRNCVLWSWVNVIRGVVVCVRLCCFVVV
jgi:hypothetical protein